ncbi:RNA polymerase sigma-70 factor, ECF subfamily [Sphingobacterium nematocida]|uniref:RNA polymerase sigma-70 factor, ECF subfamily n=1 Tax=Sphingobacterium nematocida TaxID=1513896 RepID=A0A1T5BPL6_9SPHI|nr:RNA polymerase sigma-70 factor, ECF subfamily [Sphingobacterium nematocida]
MLAFACSQNVECHSATLVSFMEETYTGDDIVPLVERLKASDKQAFNELYEKYSLGLFQLLLKMVRNRSTAEELLQNTFVKVWDNRMMLDTRKSFRAWVFKIAQNEVYTYYRKAAKDQKIQEQLYNTFDELYHIDLEQDLQSKQLDLLNRALGSLSERKRQIFELCKLQRKSYDEVAQLLDISPSTVSNLMVRSNQQIRAFVQAHYDEILLFLITCTIR